MNKDRIAGAAHQAAGAIKAVTGEVLHDPKLKAEGKLEKIGGKIQSTVGAIKDELKP